MHILTKKALTTFWEKHPESEAPLRRWYKAVSKSDFRTFSELRRAFPSVDKVGNLYVFNIGGNNYRLIAAIHFNRGKVFIQHVLTHREYDNERWKE